MKPLQKNIDFKSRNYNAFEINSRGTFRGAVLFKNEARHKGFLEQLSKVMNEFQSGGIEVEDFSSFFEASTPSENEQRLKEFGIIYRYYIEALKEDFVHQEESYAQLCSVMLLRICPIPLLQLMKW